ncbi:MAG: pseudouridine synthase [Candidatus Melainabacteria bacterium]|nr:MAG: pseudouridine synthase [Candidatus Melainabacteria bacterium]
MSSKDRFEARSDCTYIAFYKPYAVLCQFTNPADSDKETLANFRLPKSVYPLGRLDFDSEGLLLFSDDSSLNQALLNPEHAHPRVYLAQVENVPASAELKKLAQGVMVEGRLTAPAKVKLLQVDPVLPPRAVPIRFRKNIPTAWIELTLTEGRNRQVRKMTASVGHPTLRLVRVAIGDLKLFDLDLYPGQWRKLSMNEICLALERVSG